jgi:high-affinity nickel-transport protein
MQAPSRPAERIAPIFVLLILANAAAWVWAFEVFGGQPALLGTALLAWVFGLRHAFDADHIAAIDNSVRRLLRDGQAASKSGLYFALGHSTVVVLAAILVAAFASALHGPSDDLKHVGGVFGAVVSSVFLLAIGAANLLILRDVWREFRHVRHGGTLSDGSDQIGGGLISRLLRPAMGLIRRSWHLAPLGFLFGLGFDTATEIGLLGLSATEAARGMSPWHTLVFPALFTAGMTLMDTADSALMVGAYGWALKNPLRKLWYNLTITAASVAVALFIGGLGMLDLLVEEFGLEGAPWTLVGQLHDDMTNFGFIVVGIFIASWAVSAAIYRWKGYDKLPVA